MFHTNIKTGNLYDFSTKVVKRAGYGFFAHSQQLAKDLYGIISDLNERDKLIHLQTAEDIGRYFGYETNWNINESTTDGKYYYFAYGSNMLIDQMKNRASIFKPLGVALAKDYKLTFGIPGTIFSGAVANIKQQKGCHVYGVLYEVDALTLGKMDFFEGVQQGEYKKKKIKVIKDDTSEAIDSWVYYSDSNSTLIERPSKIYLTRMIQGAKENRLPEAYIERVAQRGCVSPIIPFSML